jgi:hypothetical protein
MVITYVPALSLALRDLVYPEGARPARRIESLR